MWLFDSFGPPYESGHTVVVSSCCFTQVSTAHFFAKSDSLMGVSEIIWCAVIGTALYHPENNVILIVVPLVLKGHNQPFKNSMSILLKEETSSCSEI